MAQELKQVEVFLVPVYGEEDSHTVFETVTALQDHLHDLVNALEIGEVGKILFRKTNIDVQLLEEMRKEKEKS